MGSRFEKLILKNTFTWSHDCGLEVELMLPNQQVFGLISAGR